MIETLFATVTNVDFDPQRLEEHLSRTATVRDKARALYEAACRRAGQPPEQLAGPAAWQPAADRAGRLRQGEEASIPKAQAVLGPDVAGLQELTLYGLKGAAAYADHARMLGHEDPAIYAAFHEGLDFLAGPHPQRRRRARLGAPGRRAEPEGHGAARRGQHRRLRPSRAHARARHAGQGQGHRRLRPRPEGPGRAAQADRGQGDQRLHPRRDAAGARLPGPEEVQAPGGQLRRRVAGPGQGVRRLPRRDPDDHQLHPEAARELQGPDLHQRPGGLAGRDAHRPEARLRAGHRGGAGRARLRRRTSPRRRSRSASATTPCWAWPSR